LIFFSFYLSSLDESLRNGIKFLTKRLSGLESRIKEALRAPPPLVVVSNPGVPLPPAPPEVITLHHFNLLSARLVRPAPATSAGASTGAASLPLEDLLRTVVSVLGSFPPLAVAFPAADVFESEGARRHHTRAATQPIAAAIQGGRGNAARTASTAAAAAASAAAAADLELHPTVGVLSVLTYLVNIVCF
jgi:hypothetical protein